jgi:glycosyltransferase involved in cell wall biosynthesis
MTPPIVMISSYPPRLCRVASFCEEARDALRRAHPDRDVLVISHTDGAGEGVFGLIDTARPDWWRPVAEKVHKLRPFVVHAQHEYGLYQYFDERGIPDGNEGFLKLLEALGDVPLVVEPHTVHGRLTDFEADFLFKLCRRADVVLFKHHYQQWRLDWTFTARGWPTPTNVMIVPHGARSDKRYSIAEVPQLRRELGLDKLPHLSDHLVGLIGWAQPHKRWDILTSMWEEIADAILRSSGQKWDLLAAAAPADMQRQPEYEHFKGQVQLLEQKGLAHYYEFVPHGDLFYKMMAVCDFVVLPGTDETQSGTLAKIIALNKPYIAIAPMEGLTSQTLESEGGLLFTSKDQLRRHVIELACNEALRLKLGNNLRQYLDNVAAWQVVARQYDEAHRLAREAKRTGKHVELPTEC